MPVWPVAFGEILCVGRAVSDRNCISLHDMVASRSYRSKRHILMLHSEKTNVWMVNKMHAKSFP